MLSHWSTLVPYQVSLTLWSIFTNITMKKFHRVTGGKYYRASSELPSWDDTTSSLPRSLLCRYPCPVCAIGGTFLPVLSSHSTCCFLFKLPHAHSYLCPFLVSSSGYVEGRSSEQMSARSSHLPQQGNFSHCCCSVVKRRRWKIIFSRWPFVEGLWELPLCGQSSDKMHELWWETFLWFLLLSSSVELWHYIHLT